MQGAPPDIQTDEQLMKLYQGGDEAAFRALYNRHSAKVYGFLKKRIGNNEKVAEVYQEVFIKIHKSKSLYNESFPVLPWIFTVTKSVMLDELRKDKKFQTVDIGIFESNKVGDVQATHGIDTIEMLSQLPEMQKQALEMRYINDNTFEQIAENLNIKPANARQAISRGLKRLRELISEGGKGG